MRQLVIIGGGPAGISASIYAARKKMDFVLITKEVGGQVIKAGNIENYLGYAMVDGIILVEKMMEHMRKLGSGTHIGRSGGRGKAIRGF